MGVATELVCMASFRSFQCSVSKRILTQFGLGTCVESYLSHLITDADGLQEVEASRISRQSAHEVKVSPTHWPPLPPKR